MGKKKDPMDGAYFPGYPDKSVSDYVSKADGLRPGQTKEPFGEVLVDLSNGIAGRVIPPKWAWDLGEWKTDQTKSADWDIWSVTGEGSPGNYLRRQFRVPTEEASKPKPRHPSQWPKSLREARPQKKYGGDSYQSGSGSSYSTSKASLPWELRFRCPGCGHFYKNSDLADHVKNACPATQEHPVMWIMQCVCHPDDLLAATEVLEGFPMKPPQAAQDTPDKSGDEEKEEEKEEAQELEPVAIEGGK